MAVEVKRVSQFFPLCIDIETITAFIYAGLKG